MTVFEMVKYHSQEYPANVPLRIEECAAHMDITEIKSQLLQSLHTEYSYGKRKFNSDIVSGFSALYQAQKNGVPQLWYSVEWAMQFAEFIKAIAKNNIPEIIEIHPPFNDYTDMKYFIECYKVFEENILNKYPNVDILIENRCGSVYQGGKFLISRLSDVEMLCEQIDNNNLKLKIAYDVPQIYTAHNVKNSAIYIELLEKTKNIRSFIGGVHLWGKRKSESGRLVSHCGDLNSYFSNDIEIKSMFLESFSDCFGDGICRKMVLEVNSGNEDLKSIIKDLIEAGIEFK